MFESPAVRALLLTALGASGLFWLLLFLSRGKRPEGILPRVPRRPVPWGGFDVALIGGVWILSMLSAFRLADAFVGPMDGLEQSTEQVESQPPDDAVLDDDSRSEEMAHPIARLLSQNSHPAIIALCVISAVFVAPICEEFLFRVFLQGWLERQEDALLPQSPQLKQLPLGTLPIFSTAALFALLHARVGEPPTDMRLLVVGTVATVSSNTITVGLALLWLKVIRKANSEDLCLPPDKRSENTPSTARDLLVGVVAFLAILLPVYGLHVVLLAILPKGVVPDPAPLFIFGAVAGYVVYRTRRVMTSLVMHMCFNGFTLTLLWLSLQTAPAG